MQPNARNVYFSQFGARFMTNTDQNAVSTMETAAVWVWDPDRLRIIWANDAGLRFWGELTLLDLVERDFAPFDEAVQDFGDLLHAASNRKSGQVKARMVLAPSGSPVRIDCQASRVALPDNRVGLRVEAVLAPVGAEAEVDRLREMIERTPTPISLFAEDGTLLMQNVAAHQSFGQGLESLAERYGDRTIARDALRSLLVNGAYSHAIELNTTVGPRRHRVTMRRMHDPMTSGLAAIAFFNDIADRTEAVMTPALPSPDEAQGRIASGNGGALVFDDALKILHLNESGDTLLAHPSQAGVTNIGELFPKERNKIVHALTRVRDGQIERAELFLTAARSDASSIPLKMEVGRGSWRGGAAWLATLAEHRDDRTTLLTTQDRTEDRDRPLEALGVGVATLRADGTIEAITPSGASMLGATAKALTGQMFDASLDEAAVRAFRRAFTAPPYDAQPFVIERPIVGDDPSTSLRVAISPSQSGSKESRTLVLTEIKNGNGGAGRGSARAEAIARASHELRTPLNAIIGFTEIMLDDTAAIRSDTYREYLRDIHDSGHYMARLVQDILDMRRIEAGALSLDPAPVNLANLIRRIARELEGAARARDVTITVSIDETLPMVVADAHTLRQALTNLMGNAVKFTDSVVQVSASIRNSGALRIDVTDNGEGMTDEEVERALQPYAQGRNNSRKFGGAGMGLPLAKGFVEANGGHFEMVSRKNEGSSARIVFPPRVVER